MILQTLKREEKGERKMRKVAGLLMICLLGGSFFATLSLLTPKVMGWAGGVPGITLHGKMAEDVLKGLGWTDAEIDSIPRYADEVDIPIIGLPHPGSSNHRVEEYQEMFESYGGDACSFMGAEKWALGFIAVARNAYASGNEGEGRKNLGYAIHYIQDAFCPPHVFPFAEKSYLPYYTNPSMDFETFYTLPQYSKWRSLVSNAPIEPIVSASDLESKIEEGADQVYALPCSYLRQWRDGEIPTIVLHPDHSVDQVGFKGWHMTDENIGQCMKKAASLVKGAVIWATALQKGVVRNYVPTGLAKIDFEEGTEGEVIKSTIAGLRFTTTLGYDWVYCDIRTGRYNARSLTDPSVNFGHYVVNGYFAAWLGIYTGQGRIDFVLGTASYFSVLTSTYSGLCLEAYDSNDNLIATSGWAEGNLYSYTFTRLTVAAEGIAYVIVHDTGNYWEIDDIVTDAPSWGSKISSENIKKIPQRFEMNLIEGSWTTPDSMIEIGIYDIAMRTAELLTELTPQAADNQVASFAVVLKDRNNDGKVSPEEILQNILEQIPEEIAKQYLKFIVERFSSLNLELPSPDYGHNLLTQIFNFGSTAVVPTVETYGPYVIAILAIPVAISTGFTTFGLGGYQAITGIYVPTNALLGTTGDITTTMYSHGDLVIIDSEGQVLCKEFSQIPGGTYIEVDLNGDGSLDDVAVLPATTRDYTINIVPDADASPDDTFTLTMANLGIYFNLVRDLRFSDVPEHGYGLQASMPPTDSIPPTTTLTIGNPNYTDPSGNVYVTSGTSFTLSAEDNVGGTGVASTHYRIYNTTSYDTGLITSTPPIEFHLTGIDDGEYSIDFYSVDNIGNIEPTTTQNVTLDNTPPTTTPTIGDPKYVSDKTYVTPDTPFALEATDTGSGVYSIAYRICNDAYDSGWQNYTAPFKLTSLTDGTYTIEYNSTDNVKNTETTHAINVTLFSWNYIYQDTYGRGTTLKINLAHKFFQFIRPNKDYGIKKATYMKQCGRAIIIEHCDKQLRLITVAVDTKLDFCAAIAWDLQTRKCYLLIDKAGIEK
jgi:hypothetical protein